MFEYAPRLQKTYTRIFEPAARFFHDTLHLTPNKISIAGFACVLGGTGCILFHKLEIGLAVTLIGMLLDALDGTVARLYNLHTPTGEIFETVFDGIHEVIAYPALAAAGYMSWWIALLAVPAFVILRIWKWKNQNIFDPGFKRVSIFFGYLIHFDFTGIITAIWAYFGIAVNLFQALDQRIHTKKKMENA